MNVLNVFMFPDAHVSKQSHTSWYSQFLSADIYVCRSNIHIDLHAMHVCIWINDFY